MNAQTTHSIRTSTNPTTDPQFLGPEAGQQAGGEEPGKGNSVCGLDQNGSELHRYFSVARDGQIILTPVRIQRGDAVRAKLAELDLSEADVAAAVAWARKRR